MIALVARPGHGARRPHPSRGQALVEFALVIPIVLVLFMTLVDFGRVIFAQNAITQAAREGARVGIASAKYTQVKYDAIRKGALGQASGVEVVAGNITGDATQGCSAAATAAGTTGVNDSASASTCFYPKGISTGKTVVVTIRITVPLLTPLISNILGGSFNLTAQSIGFIQ